MSEEQETNSKRKNEEGTDANDSEAEVTEEKSKRPKTNETATAAAAEGKNDDNIVPECGGSRPQQYPPPYPPNLAMMYPPPPLPGCFHPMYGYYHPAAFGYPPYMMQPASPNETQQESGKPDDAKPASSEQDKTGDATGSFDEPKDSFKEAQSLVAATPTDNSAYPPYAFPPGYSHTMMPPFAMPYGRSPASMANMPMAAYSPPGNSSNNMYPSMMMMMMNAQMPPTQGKLLFMKCDMDQLSDYQCLVRQQLELFAAGPEDLENNTQGRKKPIELGQVGLRCRHCAGNPLRHRGRGAVYYPGKLLGTYQAAQNQANSHLIQSCRHIPQDIRDNLKKLRERKDNACGGKHYWADGCRALGVVERDYGLFFDQHGPPSRLSIEPEQVQREELSTTTDTGKEKLQAV